MILKDSKGQEVFAFKFSRLSTPGSISLLSAQYVSNGDSVLDDELDYLQETYSKELALLYNKEYNIKDKAVVSEEE